MIEIGGGSALTPARQQKKLTLVRRANRHLDALTRRDHLSTSYHGFDGIPR